MKVQIVNKNGNKYIVTHDGKKLSYIGVIGNDNCYEVPLSIAKYVGPMKLRFMGIVVVLADENGSHCPGFGFKCSKRQFMDLLSRIAGE